MPLLLLGVSFGSSNRLEIYSRHEKETEKFYHTSKQFEILMSVKEGSLSPGSEYCPFLLNMLTPGLTLASLNKAPC